MCHHVRRITPRTWCSARSLAYTRTTICYSYTAWFWISTSRINCTKLDSKNKPLVARIHGLLLHSQEQHNLRTCLWQMSRLGNSLWQIESNTCSGYCWSRQVTSFAVKIQSTIWCYANVLGASLLRQSQVSHFHLAATVYLDTCMCSSIYLHQHGMISIMEYKG